MPSIEERASTREGVFAGIDWKLLLSPSGSFVNGYVRAPERHPWRRLDYSQIEVEIHGGLTYGADGDGWIGFDTGHGWDRWSDEDLAALGGKNCVLFSDSGHPEWTIHWTVDRVQEEVLRLAAAVRAAGRPMARLRTRLQLIFRAVRA